MPGAGKSTIGQMLARQTGYAFVDSDLILEALYARPLQDVTDALPRDIFLDAEADVICSLRADDCVIATGGSVIYRRAAMLHLKKLGPVVYLNPKIETIIMRVASEPNRGISFGPGQGLRELYAERKKLYEEYADFSCDSGEIPAIQCAMMIAEMVNK